MGYFDLPVPYPKHKKTFAKKNPLNYFINDKSVLRKKNIIYRIQKLEGEGGGCR